MSSQQHRRIEFGSPEWEPLIRTIAAHADIQHAFADLGDDVGARLWVLEARILQQLGVELAPFERMKLQGALVDTFFPKGVPRAKS